MIRSARPTWLATIAGVVCALAASRAWADPIDYQADPGCPDRAGFLTAAAGKSPHARGLAAAGPVRVQLRSTAAGYTGVLERRSPAGELTAPRVVSGARCQDVAEALALTLALSLVPAEAPPVVAAAAPPPVRPRGRAGRLTASLGLRGGGFVSGEPMLGPAIGVGLSRAGIDGARPPMLALEGGLRLSYGRSDVARTPERARFELLSLALELCPAHLGSGRVRLGLCGLAEAGVLGGRGIDIAHPQWGRAGWLALGGGLELSVAITRRWQLVGSGQVTRPLLATRFVFVEPDQTVARTAGVVPVLALAVAAQFP